jgi:excisionase family DNA binding protein
MMAPAMTQRDVTFQQVTVSEAAAILGVSTQTVRRMVKRGQLEGQRVIRPQGTAFVVTLPGEPMDATDDATVTPHATGNMERDNATPAGQRATWSETFLVPLVAALERSQAIVRDQAETIGRLTAQLESEKRSHSPVAPDLTRSPGTPTLGVTRHPFVDVPSLAHRPGRGRARGAAGGRRLAGVDPVTVR